MIKEKKKEDIYEEMKKNTDIKNYLLALQILNDNTFKKENLKSICQKIGFIFDNN